MYLKERDRLEDLVVDDRIILKEVFIKWDRRVLTGCRVRLKPYGTR